MGTQLQLEEGRSSGVLLHSRVTIDNNYELSIKRLEEGVLNVFSMFEETDV
jgi:hypothetical protein